MADKEFLQGAYGLDGPEATKALYRDWAQSYEDEVLANGYATPERCAVALAKFATNPDGPLLDIGCGTGLSGAALAKHGFSCIDGTDFSPEMLALAEKKGIYRSLTLGDVNTPLPGNYANAAAIGVFSPGHAPPESLHEFLAVLQPGGCLVFSLNDHALKDAAYQGAIMNEIDGGGAELLANDYGPHLPKIGMQCRVYVLRKRV